MRHYRLHGRDKIDSKTVLCKTFKDLFDNVIHFVFDSYIKLTVKDSERLKRGLHVTYELADIYTE